MKLITVISATGLAAGLALGGVVVANATSSPAPAPAPSTFSAASSSSPGITLPKGGVLENRVTTFCRRVPKLEQRAGKAQTRLSGDADTKGSIARLKARQAKATKKDHPKVAQRLGKVVDRRTKRLDRLPTVKEKLVKAQSECATLPQPVPSPS